MNYKGYFENEVERMVYAKEVPPLETRIQQVEDLTEWYFEVVGKHYNNTFYLEILGSYILADTLRDKNTHKMKHEEYPILSESQQKLRNRRESRVGDENLDFIYLKSVKTHPNAFKTTTKNKEE